MEKRTFNSSDLLSRLQEYAHDPTRYDTNPYIDTSVLKPKQDFSPINISFQDIPGSLPSLLSTPWDSGFDYSSPDEVKTVNPLDINPVMCYNQPLNLGSPFAIGMDLSSTSPESNWLPFGQVDYSLSYDNRGEYAEYSPIMKKQKPLQELIENQDDESDWEPIKKPKRKSNRVAKRSKRVVLIQQNNLTIYRDFNDDENKEN
ncbi:hypothetical protein HDV06_003090 [Boothiomyces sp. JEL0866]|nr:hypothetical protein HDV06_003090 [Boothiomyces sp. JEL0866]